MQAGTSTMTIGGFATGLVQTLSTPLLPQTRNTTTPLSKQNLSINATTAPANTTAVHVNVAVEEITRQISAQVQTLLGRGEDGK